MFLVVSLSVLLTLCAASDPPVVAGYGHIPIPLEFVAEPLLGQLFREIYSAEAKETSQIVDVQELMKVADKSDTFFNNYRDVIAQKIAYRQQKQNDRIDAIQEKIVAIQALRSKVQGLQVEASGINDQINEEVLPDQKQLLYYINDLQNSDLERISQIKETRERAGALSNAIDELIEKVWDNAKAMELADIGLIDASYVVNRQRHTKESFTLNPSSADQSAIYVPFEDPFESAPYVRPIYPTGFHVKKNKPHPYGAPPSAESIYFGLSIDIYGNGYNATSFEMSSGGWETTKLIVNGYTTYIGLDRFELPLSLK